ncbi:MAG: group II truncated hemoglobin [Pseudomonadales bacterium]|nr:group II truncated hemoglobin [Pseudomonadales bacterium]
MTEYSLYDRIGGEAGVSRLVNLFYDFMASEPEAKQILDLHHADLGETREKLFQYFTGWFDGPPLFVDLYGHPRLRGRHMHIKIGLAERDAWLLCLYHALDTMALDADLHKDLLEKIVPMADHMRNMADEAPLSDC